jgi:amidohydrolase
MRNFYVFALSAAALCAQSRDERVAKAVDALRDKLIETRRDFHMYPELSNREERTSRVIAERLRALGFEDVKTGVARHGVVATLKGGRPGPLIAVRADMDALPIQENNDVPYKSRNAGVKHACGHDAHVTIQLGVAEVLSRMRAEIPGVIRFIFQPAEEGAPQGEEGGASLMIREGVLDNPRPKAIFGLHVGAQERVGRVSYASGPLLASTDAFAVVVDGKVTHGAYPHTGIDPVPIAAEVIQAFQTIRRRVIATQPVVLTIGQIHGGTRNNILAGQVRMEGTLRTLDEEVREQVKSLMKQMASGIAQANGTTARIEWFDAGNPVTFNDPALVSKTVPSLRRILGASNVNTAEPQMGGEDFAYYQKVIPGFFYFLGVGNPDKGITAMQHTQDFDIDEDALALGVKAQVAVLLDYLEREKQN